MKEHVFLSNNKNDIEDDYGIMHCFNAIIVLINRFNWSGNTFILTLFWRVLRDLRDLFLIYPTFVGSECNKFIVISVNEWDSENDSYSYRRAADVRVRQEVSRRRAGDRPVSITIDLILYFFSPIFCMQCVSTVLIHHIKPLLLIMKRNIYPLLKVMPDRFFLPRWFCKVRQGLISRWFCKPLCYGFAR